jgi:hypothetical protein
MAKKSPAKKTVKKATKKATKKVAKKATKKAPKKDTKKKATKKATKKKPVSEKKVVAPQTIEREIQYPKLVVKQYVGEKHLSAKVAMQLLGWEAEGDNDFGDDYAFKDANGVKVRCTNNQINRPVYFANITKLRQDILRGEWRLNGSPRVIGKTGQLIDGQHTLISLVLAAQLWRKDQALYQDIWPGEPTIDTLIVFGIDEDDKTVNTFDTGKPRSLSDVLYRLPYFREKSRKDRERMTRALDFAIRNLWLRTGVKASFEIKPTMAEQVSFLVRHPKLIDCVDVVYELDGDDRHISRYLSLGVAASLLYLFGCAGAKRKAYHQAEEPNEGLLTWKFYKTARTFFQEFAEGADSVIALRHRLATIGDDIDSVSRKVKEALFVVAWNAYVDEKPVDANSLLLDFSTNDDGITRLATIPGIGGIDIDANYEVSDETRELPPLPSLSSESDENSEIDTVPPSEITKKRPVKKKATPKKAAKKKATKKAAKKKSPGKRKSTPVAPTSSEVADRASSVREEATDEEPRDIRWIVGKTGEAYRVEVVRTIGTQSDVKVCQGFAHAGSEHRIVSDRLLKKQPTPKK